jgi:hypothetical protein
MTAQEISVEEGNKLIHRFRGFERIKDTTVLTDDQTEAWYKKDGVITQGIPDYHNDWNELMPVVEKIESIVYNVRIVSDRFQENGLFVNGTTFDVFKREKEIVWVSRKSKINAVWLGVIQFIQWYNEQN